MKVSQKVLPLFISAICFISCNLGVNAHQESGSEGTSTETSPSTTDETTENTETTSSVTATATGSSFSAEQKIYINLTEEKVCDDNATWQSIGTKKTSFFDGTVTVKFTEDESKESTGVIKIDAEDVLENLAIYFTGEKNGGGVKIQTSLEHETGIYLDGVSITSTNYPCIDITKGGAATVFLTGTNTLVDGRKYGYGYGDSAAECDSSRIGSAEGSDSKGTLYCKGGLSIVEAESGGALYVTQAYKNCIASKDGYLTIEGGILELKNYFSSSDTGKNGLFGGLGIIVNGGSINFDGKGIVTTSDIRKANGFKTDDDDYPQSYVKINGGNTNVITDNGKGISAPKIYIAGGTNTFEVTGTTSYSERTSNGSWFDADGIKESGTVKFAPEGIEAESLIEISGGSTIVSAYDDGMNVSTTGGNLNISGGFLYVSSKGDGLDSNGNIKISGGTTVVSQTGGGNSPIDCGDGSYSFTVTGTDATVFAMGSSDMFNESIPSSTVNPMIYSTSLNGTSSLAVDGIIGINAPQSYGAALLVSSKLTNGNSYSFVRGGTLNGTEVVPGSGVYFPVSVSGTSGVSVTVTATTSNISSGGGFGPRR